MNSKKDAIIRRSQAISGNTNVLEEIQTAQNIGKVIIPSMFLYVYLSECELLDATKSKLLEIQPDPSSSLVHSSADSFATLLADLTYQEALVTINNS